MKRPYEELAAYTVRFVCPAGRHDRITPGYDHRVPLIFVESLKKSVSLRGFPAEKYQVGGGLHYKMKLKLLGIKLAQFISMDDEPALIPFSITTLANIFTYHEGKRYNDVMRILQPIKTVGFEKCFPQGTKKFIRCGETPENTGTFTLVADIMTKRYLPYFRLADKPTVQAAPVGVYAKEIDAAIEQSLCGTSKERPNAKRMLEHADRVYLRARGFRPAGGSEPLSMVQQQALKSAEKERSTLEFICTSLTKSHGSTVFVTDVEYTNSKKTVLLERNSDGQFVYGLKEHVSSEQIIARSIMAIKYRFVPPTDLQLALMREAGEKLNVKQRLALYHAVQNPITFIQGPPGTGKTQVIQALAGIFQETAIVMTFVGLMARALAYRLQATQADARTIHSAAYSSLVAKAKPSTIIIDEACNAGLPEMKMALHQVANTSCDAKRIVFVMDRWQVPPISPGQPAVDMAEYFGARNTIELTENMRVVGGEREVLRTLSERIRNADQLKEWEPTWSLAKPDSILEAEEGGSYPPIHICDEPTSVMYESDYLNKILTLLCIGPRSPLRDPLTSQFLALTNEEVRGINFRLDRLFCKKLEQGLPRDHPYSMFPGRKVIIREPIEAVSAKRKVIGNRFNNGDIMTVASCIRDGEAGTVTITFTDQSIIFIGPQPDFRSIAPDRVEEVIQPAWCITANLSQGREWKRVCFYMAHKRPEDVTKEAWSREYINVAFTRCMGELFFLGSLERLRATIRRIIPKRKTFLQQHLVIAEKMCGIN